MQGRPAPLLVVLLAGLAACTPDIGLETHDISREDYGARWPLTADTAVLTCEPGGVPTVTVDGTTYGLDTADERKVPRALRLERVLADEPGGGTRDATVLLRDALALCGGMGPRT